MPLVEYKRRRAPEIGRRQDYSSFLLIILTLGTLALGSAVGCTSLWKPKSENEINDAKLAELKKAPPTPDLVRDAAVPNGLHPIQIDGVGSVTQLPGTGGPADPSYYRDELIEEMKRHDIKDPNKFLELDSNALVRVRALIPPGARRGDPIDIRVLAPDESQVSDLGGGWLLDTRLRRQIRLQQRMMQRSVHSGEVLAIATGPVVTRGSHTPGDDVANRVEGNVISGGRVQENRLISLVLRPEYQHVKVAIEVSKAINKRFFFFDGATRRGIANPREDDLIELEVHPRYRNNVYRMMEVVRAIGVEPESSKTQVRLSGLAKKLSSPGTAADAALQLEGIGESAVPTLLDALRSDDREIRFYAAEALAYLDREESVDVLEASARDVAAFRAPALMALQELQHPLAENALRRLIDSPSMETRYGAFCSLRRRSDVKRTLGGQSLGQFWLYQMPSTESPCVVISLRESPEIVVFGSGVSMPLSKFLRGPSGIMIKADLDSMNESGQPTRLKISRFQAGEDDKRATTSSSIDSVISGLASVGAGYGEVIEVLRRAKDDGQLQGQLAIDPLPRSLRTYYRDSGVDESSDDEDEE
jgi:flagellar basal body P-ring protein FlgI